MLRVCPPVIIIAWELTDFSWVSDQSAERDNWQPVPWTQVDLPWIPGRDPRLVSHLACFHFLTCKLITTSPTYLQGPWGFRWSTVCKFGALSPHWFSTLLFLQVTAEDGDLLPVSSVHLLGFLKCPGLGGLPGIHLLGQCSLGSKRSGQLCTCHLYFVCLTYPSHVKTTA